MHSHNVVEGLNISLLAFDHEDIESRNFESQIISSLRKPDFMCGQMPMFGEYCTTFEFIEVRVRVLRSRQTSLQNGLLKRILHMTVGGRSGRSAKLVADCT